MNTTPNTPLDREVRIQTVCQMVLATVAIVGVLYWLRPVLLPFVLAVFLVTGIAPLLELIQRRLRAPRIMAVAITFLLGIALLSVLWLVIWLSVASLLEDADMYRNRFHELVERISARLPEAPFAAGGAELDAPPAENPNADENELAAFTAKYVRTGMAEISAALMDVLASAATVLIFMFFLLLGGSSASLPQTGIWVEIVSKIRNYIVTKTIISVFTGGLFGLVLWLYGIPLAVVFALLAFLLNFIPSIGPILASLLPLPVILLSPELGVGAMALVIGLTASIQFVSGNLIEPKVMGDSFQLHPVAVLLSLMLWGVIWGIIGMILATPITAAMKILFERFDHTRPIAQLLAGRFDAVREFFGEGTEE